MEHRIRQQIQDLESKLEHYQFIDVYTHEMVQQRRFRVEEMNAQRRDLESQLQFQIQLQGIGQRRQDLELPLANDNLQPNEEPEFEDDQVFVEEGSDVDENEENRPQNNQAPAQRIGQFWAANRRNPAEMEEEFVHRQ